MAENESIFAPVHMRGAEEIAEVFGVKRDTVVEWYRNGAPIHMIGKKYQANYAELWDWLKKNAGN
jgi:excisionase family DNA binding protein